MNVVHAILLHAALAGFTLVIIVFLLFIPFYRSLTGIILFCVKLNFWLILLLAVLLYHGLEEQGLTATILRSVLYPFTTITGFTLFGVILRAQIGRWVGGGAAHPAPPTDGVVP